MTGVEEGKGSGGGEGTDVSATDKIAQQNGALEKAPVVAGTNMETLPRPGKQSDPSTAFLRAARAGQLEKVLELLESGVDINASNANGLNALHLAAKDGHLEIVRELLTRGATVDAATKKGNTALHIASLAGQEEVVQLLVQKGASVNAQSQNGFTPLYMAAQENHDSVVKFLLSKGANQTLATEDGFTPLAVAMQQGHDKVVAVLLESDTRGKVRLPALHIAAKKDDCKAAALLLQNDHNPDVTSKSGFTPLHIAAHYGNDRIASLLYEKGADVNFAAKHNITPMHVAAKWGKIKMVNLLMSKGANISAKTRDGLTPLHCAARAGHHEVVDILIEKGAPIGSKTKNGLAPLHMASQGDHVDAARILLYHRAPVDEVTVDYLTALHVAAHCGHVRVAKLLLDRNADPNARALNGFTPLHIACKKNRIKVVELLLKHKASIEATTESGLTPLHVASFMGCMNIVIYLLQNEASPDIPTVRGETPLHLAARANQTDIIRILLRNGAQVDARAREEQTPLHVASRLGNVDIVMLLLQHGADVDATTKDLYTPLHIAAKEGQEEVASVLLENGASLTATTKKGFTPLHLAAKYGNMNVARLLLQKNAPVDAQGKNGVTPLHVASHYDHQNVALLLLDKGASPHAMAKNGHTPLHIAARKNQMDIATTLLEYGAKANAESKAGFTPLHLSAQEGHTDMSTLLIEHKADTNHRAKNGLTPLHLCAQEDKTNVATILVKNGAQIDAKTKAGYTPLHVASHFGQAAMVRFLLRNGAAVDSGTSAGYTPLHQAAQQGHTLIINLLLESKAKPNAVTNNGQTALAIAQKLGYISVVETLKVVTETVITTTHTITIEEKYKVQAPESMQETFMSDSEDEGGGDEIGMAAMNVYGQPPHAQHVYLPSYYQGQMTYTREDPMLSDQQQYRYMTVDDMKSMGDDSMRVNVTDDEKDNRHSGGVSVTDMVTKETYQRTHAANLKPDNVDIHRHPVHVGLSLEFLNSSLAALGSHSQGQGMWRDRIPQWRNFLVSFLVDARGGAMRGCRHSGVRVIVPPRKAAMPMRVTCRYLKRDKLSNPPPLMEGEALASRILELGPVGAKFLGPVIIEVPHFASLRGKEREIVILRSDNGETWREHTLEASEEAVQDVLNESFEGEELSQLEDLQTSRIVRILTVDFPHYFAVVSRIRQEVHAVGPEGGTVSSSAVPQVQAVFPPAALTKKIRVGLQAHPIPVELVAKLLGNRVAVSPIVTVEPRRRKFHKPITLTIPVPQAANKGMINQYSGETPTLRLLCSITGGQSRAVWEDVTGSTPLQFVKDCVSFTTTVSARFWLMDCRNVTEATRMATELYTHATHVPFMAKFVVFAKRVDPLEARLRVFCMTDDKEDKTLEHQEHFTEVAKSRDVEVLEGKTQYMEFAGNLVPVLKSGEQLQLPFRGFKENRVPFTARVKDPDSADMVGRIMFMSEPKVAKGEPPQTPICTLNILLPEKISPDAAHSELDLLELSKNYSFLRDGGISRPDTIHRATIRLTDIANLLDKDWEKLAEEMNISPSDVELIKTQHPDKPALQAAAMFKIWQANGNKATGNTLEKALNKIGREDIVKKCIFNVELVTDDVEKAVARVRLDQPGFDSLKEELGPSRDSSLRRDGTLGDRKVDLDYNEPDRMRDSESIEDLRAVGNVSHKQTKPLHITINGTTVFNGTSTPIKDKYASDEKELVDDMADFLQQKCQKTDTMTKRIRDEADNDNRNRQKIIEDANRLVTGVLQDAEKEKEKLAKEGLSGVYDDTSIEAEGAVGQIPRIIVKESVGRGEESIEPLIIKKRKIDTPHGTIITTVTTTTKGDPMTGTVVSQTKTVKETITPGQVHLFETKKPVTVSEDTPKEKVTITKTMITLDSDFKDVGIPRITPDKSNAPMAAFDLNVEADRNMEQAEDIVRIQPDPALMSVKGRSASKSDELLKRGEDIAEKTMKNKLNVDVKDSKTEKTIKETEAGAYEGVYNVHSDDSKVDDGKKKEKAGIFSGIFKGPRVKKGKKRDSKEVSFDSGDEDIKVTKEFLEDTRKVADLTRDSPRFEYPTFDPTTHICICPPKLPEHEPNRDPIWATADFLYDSKRSAEAFVPEIDHSVEEQEIKPIDGVAITPEVEKTPEKKSETKLVSSSEDHKEKHGFFSGLFKGSKKHDGDVESPVLKAKKEKKDITEKYDDEKDHVDASVKSTTDGIDTVMISSKKSTLDSIKDVQKGLRDDGKQIDDRLKRLSSDLKSLDEKIKSDAEVENDIAHAAAELKSDVKEATDETKDKSGGFFGIFKSPKAKNRRSRSNDRDTSKDVSFDSGDEELRITTAAFLHDTRKAADNALPELEEGPQGEEQIELKSKVDDAKYCVGVSIKATTGEIDTAMITPKKSVLDDMKDFQKDIRDDKKQTDDRLKRLSSDVKSLDRKIKSDADEIQSDIKHAAAELKSDVNGTTGETKDKSGGFFGIFKSPKAKNRRSQSREKDTSKDVSFDSGDEELRITTAAFLDDIRKATDNALPQLREGPQEEEQIDIKVRKFIATVPEGSDLPKDKLKGSSYDIETSKVVTAPVSTTKRTLVSDSDLDGVLQSPEQKSTHVDKKKKAEKRRSGEFSDSADEGKSKGTSFFEKFKSPKLRSRKKNRSRDRSTSTEPSFDSGDEEVRNATSQFLEDTRKIADVTGGFDEPRKSLKDTVITERVISPMKGEVKVIHHESIDGKSKDDDDKGKSGLFGIFKSSKNASRKRSKSREKSSSTDVSFDSGDEELRIVTSKLLDDTRKIADIMEEHPYPSAPAIESPAPVHEKGKDEEKPIQAGDKSGFLSGIFESAKHVVEEVTDDVKEFWEETKEEAEDERDRAQYDLEKNSKAAEEVRDKKAPVRKAAHAKPDEKVDKTLDEATTTLQTTLDEVKHISDDIELIIADGAAKGSTEVKEKTSKINRDIDKAKKSITKPFKKEIDPKQGRVAAGTKKAGDSSTAAKPKTEKETEKPKEKGGGLISGIIKGAKHAVDEVSEDVKEFWEETQDEAKKEEEQAQNRVEADDKESSLVKDSDSSIDETSKKGKAIGKKGTGPSKGIRGKVNETITTTVKTTRISPPKNGKITDQMKKATPQPLKEDSKTVKRKVSDTDKTVAAKARATKETVAEKAKAAKDVPDKPKMVKDTPAEKGKSAKETGADKAKFAKGSPIEKPKPEKNNGSEKTKPTRQSPPKVAGDVDPAKKEISKQVKTDPKLMKSKIDVTSKATVGVKDITQKKEKEVKKDKDKGSNLWTGITKAVKHAADEVAEDVNQFLDQTRKDAEEQERLEREVEEAARALEDKKNKTVQDIEAAKDDASYKVTEQTKDIVNLVHATDEGTTKIIDGVDDHLTKDAKLIKDQITETATAVIDSTERVVDKTEKEARKAKDKGKGFLFGILKGAKHSSDETAEDIQDTFEDAKERAKKSKEALEHKVEDAKKNLIDDVKTMKIDLEKEIEKGKTHVDENTSRAVMTVKDSLDATQSEGQKELAEAKRSIDDALREPRKKIDDGTSEVHIAAATMSKALEETFQATVDTAREAGNRLVETKDASVKKVEKNIDAANEQLTTTAEKLSDSVKAGKEKTKKDATKARDKSKAFFTTMFKGSKHAVEDATDNVSDFLEKTKEEAAKEKEHLQHGAERVVKDMRNVEAEFITDLDAGKGAILNIAKTANDTISSTAKQASKATADTAKTITEDLHTKHSIVETIKTDATTLEEGVHDIAHGIVETADKSKEKIDKETTKAKDKTKGFFSGIFKTVKHASDEAVEDTGDLADKAEKKLGENEHKISEHVSDTAKIMTDVANRAKNETISTIVARKDAVGDAAQTAAEAVSSTTDEVEEAMKNTAKKIVDSAVETNDSVSVSIRKDIGSLEHGVKNVAHAVVDSAEESKDKIGKEAGKTTDKTKGFFTGIFKGAKRATDEVSRDTKDFLHETKKEIEEGKQELSKQVSETKADITDAAGKAKDKVVETAVVSQNAVADVVDATGDLVSNTAEKVSKATKDKTLKISDHIVESKDAITEKVKKDTGSLKEGVKDIAHKVVDTAEKSENKAEKEAAKAKEKTKGFFSGIFKGARHEANEIAKDTEDLVHDSKQEIEQDIQKLSEKVSDIRADATVAAGKIEEQVVDSAVAGKKEVADVVGVAVDVVSSTAEQARKATEVTAREIVDDVVNTKDTVIRNVKKDVESLKAGAEEVANAASDTAKENKQRAEEEALKVKEKSKGFFSGILKGVKHTADEVVDDVKEFIHETKQEAKKDEERLSKHISDTTANVQDIARKAADKVVDNAVAATDTAVDRAKAAGDTVSSTTEQASKTVNDKMKEVSDDIIMVKDIVTEKLEEGIENVKDEARNVVTYAKDKEEKEVTKAEGKTNGVATDTNDFLDHTKKEIERDRETLAEQVSDTTITLTDAAGKAQDAVIDTVTASEDIVIDAAETTSNVLLSSVDHASKTTKDAAKKVADGLVDVKDAVTVKVKTDTANVKDVAYAVAETVEENKGNVDKEAAKVKEKNKGFFSGIFKGTKQTVEEMSASTKDLVDQAEKKIKGTDQEVVKKISDTKKTMTDNAGKVKIQVIDTAVAGKDIIIDAAKTTSGVLSNSTEHVSQTMKHAGEEIVDGVTDAKNGIKENVQADIDNLKDKMEDVACAVGDSARETKDKTEKEATKVKAKTKGFFSGIFKGSKHTTDEVVDDVKEFIHDTKEEAKQDKEKVSKHIADTTASVIDAVEKTKDQVLDTAVAGKNVVADIAKATGNAVSSNTDQAATATKDVVKKIEHEMSKTKGAINDELKRDAESLKDGSKQVAHAVSDSAEETKDKVEKETAKAKEKTRGFFSGIFKGAKHAADEVVEDVKEFIHDTEEEVKQDKEKVTKHIVDTTTSVTGAVEKTKDQVLDTAVAGKNVVADITKATDDAVSSTIDQAATATKDGVKKIEHEMSKTKEAITDELKRDAESLKDGTKQVAHAVSDSAEETKDKVEKETAKAKEKTRGFFSGIFKGAKHATDEVVEDVKEFIRDTEEQAIHEEEKIAEQIVDTTKTISGTAKIAETQAVNAVVVSKHAVADAEKAPGDAVASSAEQASKAIKDTAEKITDDIIETKDSVTEKLKKDTDSVKAVAHAIADAAEERKDIIEKEAVEAKDKTRGFLSGIFKETKNAAGEVSEGTQDLINETGKKIDETEQQFAEKISDSIKTVVDAVDIGKDRIIDTLVASKDFVVNAAETTGSVVSNNTEDALESTKDTAKKVVDGIVETKDTATKELKKDVVNLKGEVEHIAHTVADTAKENQDNVEKEALKAKEKTKGFFSGIFKGMKHATDEVSDNTNDFLDQTRKEIEQDREKLVKQASESTTDIAEVTRKVKDGAIDTAVVSGDAIVDGVKSAGDTISSTVDHMKKETEIKAGKVAKHVKNLEDEVKNVAHTAADTAQESKDTVDIEAAKAKEKTKSFFSGIFKGAKHTTGEMADTTKDLAGHAEETITESNQQVVKTILDAKTTVTDAAGKVKDQVVDGVVDVAKTTDEVAKKIADGVQQTKDATFEKVGKTTESLKDEVKEAAHTVAEIAEETQDKAGKEVTKTKDKTKGFFSGIFKGAKHAADEVVDDVKEFMHATEEEAQQAEERVRKSATKTVEDTKKTIDDSTAEISAKVSTIIDTSNESKDGGHEKVKKIDKSASDTTKIAGHTISDATHAKEELATKIGVKLSHAKDIVVREMETDASIVEGMIAGTADAASAAQEKIEKKTKKSKEKTKGFLSGIFKGAKTSTEEAINDVSDFLHKAKQEADEEAKKAHQTYEEAAKSRDKAISDLNATKGKISRGKSQVAEEMNDTAKEIAAKGKQELRAGQDALKEITNATDKALSGKPLKVQGTIGDAAEKIGKEIDISKKHLSAEVDEGLLLVEEKETKGVEAVADSVHETKTKGKGFLSGILKGAKHAVDEIAADIDDFKAKTRKEAEEEEEAARKALENAMKSMKEVSDEVTTDINVTKKNVSDKISGSGQRAGDVLAASKIDTEKNLATAGRKISNAGEIISDASRETVQDVRDLTKKVDDQAHEVKLALDKQLKEDLKIPNVIAESTEVAEHKSKGFLSDIFKSGKQAVNETAHDTPELINKGKKECQEGKQAAVKSRIDAHNKAAIKIQSGEPHVVQQISQTSHIFPDATEIKLSDIKGLKTEFEDENSEARANMQAAQLSEKVFETEQVVDDAFTTVELGTSPKGDKSKKTGFLSGIVKGAKHALEEVTDDVKEFWDETKEEAAEEKEYVKHTIAEAEKGGKRGLDSFRRDLKMDIDAQLTFKDLETDTSRDEKVEKSKIKKDKGQSGPIFGILRRDKHDKNERDEQMTVGQIIEDRADTVSKSTKTDLQETEKEVRDEAKALGRKIIDQSNAAADSADAAKAQIGNDAKKTKEKSSNFFSGIIKGTKHAIEEVSDDVKEFWDDSKQSAEGEDKRIEEQMKKTAKQVEGRKDEILANSAKELETGVSSEYEWIVETIEDSSSMSKPSAQSPTQDPRAATLAFLEDSRESAMRMDDRIPITSIEIKSSPEEKWSKGNSKGIISSMLKGTKKATEKFWDDTKPEFVHESGSYDVSSPQRRVEKKIDKVHETQVTLESFGPIEGRVTETCTETKSVSFIPQRIDAAENFDRKVRVISTETSLERELDDSNRVKGVGHLEPHARQTVTTVVTKSSMRTTMSTPPSPDELGDSRIKDVTEEAAKRAQSLADQAYELEKSGHDSAEIDGTVERHVTSAPTKQPVPDSRHFTKSSSLKKELCLDLEGNKHHPKSQSPKSKIPQALNASPKPLVSVPLDDSLGESSQKSKIPIKAKEGKKESKDDGVVTKITKLKTEDGDTTVVSRQSVVTEKLEGDNGETSVITRTVTSIVSEGSGSLSQTDMDKLLESRDLVTDPTVTAIETSTRAVITERIPKSTSKEENSVCTSVKETIRSISTKSSWESSSRSHSKDNWDQVQCSLDTSPGSGDIAFTKNGDSRHELPSDSDSDGSPRAHRRSLSKRRTLGSSSGSDVALHEGAELSPLEDDQESDFMQQSEPSYVETTTTEIDPVTNERITRTTRVLTASTIPGGAAGSDELRESMQKIVDQFMTEERRGQ